MSKVLATYLIGSLLFAVGVEVALYGTSHWSRGLVAWAVSGFLAYLLFGEQRGHPAVLLVPLTALVALLYLKTLAYS